MIAGTLSDTPLEVRLLTASTDQELNPVAWSST